MMRNEELLLQQSRDGDIASFEALVEPYQRYIYNIAYRMVGNEEDAKDMAQDALIKVYKNIGKFEGKSKFTTWIYRITVNVCQDALRRKKHVVSLDEAIETKDSEVKMQVAGDEYEPEKVLEQNEVKRLVHDGLNRLPEKYKTLLILRELQGLSYQEISECLELPIGTVRSRLSRSKEALKKEILALSNINSNRKEGYDEVS